MKQKNIYSVWPHRKGQDPLTLKSIFRVLKWGYDLSNRQNLGIIKQSVQVPSLSFKSPLKIPRELMDGGHNPQVENLCYRRFWIHTYQRIDCVRIRIWSQFRDQYKNEIIIDFSKFWKYMALNIIIEEMEK